MKTKHKIGVGISFDLQVYSKLREVLGFIYGDAGEKMKSRVINEALVEWLAKRGYAKIEDSPTADPTKDRPEPLAWRGRRASVSVMRP